ncbi:MAG: PTS fructose transporter subunit IIA [Granulosicoccaceae bacterium]|jgi:PTS system ascorbate-specific IIA component
MSVSLLIITHNTIGQSLADVATNMLGSCPMPVDVLKVNSSDDPEMLVSQARAMLANHTGGTLILTDMYGSTPSNIACKLARQQDVRIVGGINLPMLVRVLNYPRLGLDELVQKAVSGGRDGVVTCQSSGAGHD